MEISLDNDTQVETVVRLEKREKWTSIIYGRSAARKGAALLLFAGTDGIIALYLPLCGGGRRGGAPRRGPAGRESRAAQGGNRVC